MVAVRDRRARRVGRRSVRSERSGVQARRVAGSAKTLSACAADTLRGLRTVAITADALLRRDEALELACVVHAGLTDDAAFGNVLLAQAGLPAVVADREELRGIFAADVALFAQPGALKAAAVRFAAEPALRERFGSVLAADARRRFAPRRSAIRVVDLLGAARFGLERAGARTSDTPL